MAHWTARRMFSLTSRDRSNKIKDNSSKRLTEMTSCLFDKIGPIERMIISLIAGLMSLDLSKYADQASGLSLIKS